MHLKQEQVRQSLDHHNKKSLIQSFFPKYRREKEKTPEPESQEQILDYVQLKPKVTKIFDRLDDIFNCRMNFHQNELMMIFKKEIDEILKDVKNVVVKYNKEIFQKSTNQELFRTRNQLQYFRHQCLKLFEENKSLRGQIQALKLKQYLQEKDLAAKKQVLFKINYKLEKQKSLKNHYKRHMSQDQLNEIRQSRKIYPTQKSLCNIDVDFSCSPSSPEKHLETEEKKQQAFETPLKIKFPTLFSKSVENKFKLKGLGKSLKKSTEFNEISTNQKSQKVGDKIERSDKQGMKGASEREEQRNDGKRDRVPSSNTYKIEKEYVDEHLYLGKSEDIMVRTPKMKRSAQIIKYKLSLPRNL